MFRGISSTTKTNDEAHYGKGSGSTDDDYPDDLPLARTDVPIAPVGLRESRQSQKQRARTRNTYTTTR